MQVTNKLKDWDRFDNAYGDMILLLNEMASLTRQGDEFVLTFQIQELVDHRKILMKKHKESQLSVELETEELNDMIHSERVRRVSMESYQVAEILDDIVTDFPRKLNSLPTRYLAPIEKMIKLVLGGKVTGPLIDSVVTFVERIIKSVAMICNREKAIVRDFTKIVIARNQALVMAGILPVQPVDTTTHRTIAHKMDRLRQSLSRSARSDVFTNEDNEILHGMMQDALVGVQDEERRSVISTMMNVLDGKVFTKNRRSFCDGLQQLQEQQLREATKMGEERRIRDLFLQRYTESNLPKSRQ
jgi:hypothetical protein